MIKAKPIKNRRLYETATAVIANLPFINFLTERLYTGNFKSIPIPVMNCYACPASVFSCPIGTLVHFMSILKFPFLVLGIIGTIGASFGRWICGWACPFGLLQDMIYKLPSIKLEPPLKLRYLKYIFLIFGVFLLPPILKEHVFCMICPVGTLEAGIYWVGVNTMIANMAGAFFLFKLSFASLILYLSVFIKRPFCRYICPLGALFSLFNRFSMVNIDVDRKSCIGCNLCQKSCPVNHAIYKDPRSTECIRCLNCVRICPAVRLTNSIMGDKKFKGISEP